MAVIDAHPDVEKRMDVPKLCQPGPANPMGARAMYLYEGNKTPSTAFTAPISRRYIGEAISSGCIRLTNEDVIDLYKRVKPGAVVMMLAPHQGDSPVKSASRISNHALPLIASAAMVNDLDAVFAFDMEGPRYIFRSVGERWIVGLGEGNGTRKQLP